MISLYKSDEPIVSIILPTFNRAKLLPRAVDSVLRQTFENWELIIVDDGSTDETFKVVADYQKQYENIRYLRHSNRKPPLTLNAGILAACGKYITLLNSDDEYTPEHLQLRFDFLEKNKEIDFIYGGIKVIGNQYVKDKNDLSKTIHISKCAVGGTFFARREVFFELDGFNNISYSEDSEFFERVQLKFTTKEVDWKTYIYYRDNPDSICNTI